jgi:phosphoribosylaminoimidazole-succinocarboxamide synthase
MQQGFQGKTGEKIPHMSDHYCESVSKRYIELYETLTGEKFITNTAENLENRLEKNILNYLNN